MTETTHPSSTQSEALRLPWLITGATISSLLLYVLLAHGMIGELQGHVALAEDQRIVIRTVFYLLAIVGLPITNLIRHVQVRLNQTMPGPATASRRYRVTVLVSMAQLEMIGLFGLVMFILGDDFNSLYIFNGVAALGIYLYRPKALEYSAIVSALAAKASDS